MVAAFAPRCHPLPGAANLAIDLSSRRKFSPGAKDIPLYFGPAPAFFRILLELSNALVKYFDLPRRQRPVIVISGWRPQTQTIAKKLKQADAFGHR